MLNDSTISSGLFLAARLLNDTMNEIIQDVVFIQFTRCTLGVNYCWLSNQCYKNKKNILSKDACCGDLTLL
mgnify:CR=1 FL=1